MTRVFVIDLVLGFVIIICQKIKLDLEKLEECFDSLLLLILAIRKFTYFDFYGVSLNFTVNFENKC